MKGLNTDWTSKQWNERYFPAGDLDGDGDTWGMRWRGMEKMRYASYLAVLDQHLRGPDPLRILDIGCALCDFTTRAWKLNTDNQFSCVDISTNAIAWASSQYPQFEFKTGALPDIPFEGEFDLIFCLQILVYLDSAGRKASLKNMHDHLSPSGKVMFSGMLSLEEYHTEEEVRELFAEGFDILHLRYNYWMLHQKLIEFPLQKISPVIERMLELLQMPREEFQEFLAGKSGSAKFVVLKVLRLLNPLTTWLVRLMSGTVRLIRGSRILAVILSKVQKVLSGGKNPDEIVVLAVRK